MRWFTRDRTDRGRRRIGKAALAVLVLCLVGALSYFAYQHSPRAAQADRTIQPTRTDIRRTIIANGSIAPRKEINMKPQISGVIQKILVERGNLVKRGDLIAVIHPLPDPGAVNDAQVELERARIDHRHAKQEFDRVGALFKNDFVARVDYDRLERDVRLASEREVAAQRQLEIVRTGASTSLGRSASEVRATIAGTILERPVEIGTFVIESNTFNEGTTIVSIADMSDLIFRGKVDEPDAGALQVGMPVSVVIGALAHERFEGKLAFIAPKATDKDGVTTFEVRVSLTLTADKSVRAGYSATAELVVDQRTQALTLPERYVRFQNSQPYVMVETAPGVFEHRSIGLGLSDGITTEIVSGLNEGNRVRIE